MQSQDDLLFSSPLRHSQDFQVDLLVDEDENGLDLMPTDPAMQRQPENDMNTPAQDMESVIFRSLICENEQLDIQFPVRPYQEQVEDDLIDFGSHPKVLIQPSPIQHKISKKAKSNYLEETRAEKIARFREKKCRRIWNRKVFYDCRKQVADNRERVNGRFVKKSPHIEAVHKSSLATVEIEGGREEKHRQKISQIDDFYL